MPMTARRPPSLTIDRLNRPRCGAERQPDAHLAAAPAHRVAQHTVQADGRKHERERREGRHEQQCEAFLRHAAADHIVEHPRVVQDERRVDARQLAARVTQQPGPIAVERDDLSQLPVAIARELGMRVVDVRPRRCAGADRHVADNADDLRQGTGDAQPLSDRILRRKHLPRELLAHHDAPRRRGIVFGAERPPAQQRNPDRLEIPAFDHALLGRRRMGVRGRSARRTPQL